MLGQEPAAELDVLDDGNAWTYWSRSDAHTMALNIGSNPRSREGLARVIEVWVRHLLNVEVRVEPVAAIEDRDWRWFVGLDAEATRDRQRPVDRERPSTRRRRRGCSRCSGSPSPTMRRIDPRVAGHPVYCLLAMTADGTVRLKPQNLIMGLPLAGSARAA